MNSDVIVNVANKVVLYWQHCNDYDMKTFRVICHGRETQDRIELESRTFSVGVENDLTSVSFNDLILIYAYLAWYIPNRTWADSSSKSVTLNATNELFQWIVEKCCFEFDTK